MIEPIERLRLYADFNNGLTDDRGEWCTLLRSGDSLLDDVAEALGVHDGMLVTLFYEDPAEEFEVDAVLGHIAAPGWEDAWAALIDWSTFRRLRG